MSHNLRYVARPFAMSFAISYVGQLKSGSLWGTSEGRVRMTRTDARTPRKMRPRGRKRIAGRSGVAPQGAGVSASPSD